MYIELDIGVADDEAEALLARRRRFLAGMDALEALAEGEDPLPNPVPERPESP